MTTYSQSDLATRVLRDLGLVPSDEVPTADDLADAEEIIGSEVEQMGMRGLPIWNGSDMAVPKGYLTALSRRLGLAVGPSYGVFTMIEAAVGIEPAERILRQLSAIPPTGSVADGEYM